MYYVYLLKNEEGTKYIGFTSNLRRRVEEHNQGINVSTKGHKWVVVYYEGFRAESDARKREKNLKQSGQGRRWLYERVSKSFCV